MGVVFGPCFELQYLVSFLYITILAEEEREHVLFKFFAYCCVDVSVLCLFLAVPYVGLWSEIVAFSGDTHFLLDNE